MAGKLSGWATAALASSLALVAAFLLAGLMPGELLVAGSAFLPPWALYAFSALLLVGLSFNAFLRSGHRSDLWVGVAFFMMALPFALVIVPADLNVVHSLAPISVLLSPLAFFYAYIQEERVPAWRRFLELVVVLAGAAVATVLLLAGITSLTPLIEGNRHTLTLGLLMLLASLMFILTALLFLRLHARTGRLDHLAISVGSVWIVGGTLAGFQAKIHIDEWHLISYVLVVVAFLVFLGGFVAEYQRTTPPRPLRVLVGRAARRLRSVPRGLSGRAAAVFRRAVRTRK